MSMPIPLRGDFDGSLLRHLARATTVLQFMRDDWLSNRIVIDDADIVAPLLRRLDKARRSTPENHLHRDERLGTRVPINASWHSFCRCLKPLVHVRHLQFLQRPDASASSATGIIM